MNNISIAQLWREFKELPQNKRLKFIFFGSEIVYKEQTRFLLRVETNNIITIRELDNKAVWLGRPKVGSVFKDGNKYLFKDYLAGNDNNDLVIEVCQ